MKPSIPRYTGSEWVEGPYHVKAEEVMLWSGASLIVPLTHEAFERYETVFTGDGLQDSRTKTEDRGLIAPVPQLIYWRKL